MFVVCTCASLVSISNSPPNIRGLLLHKLEYGLQSTVASLGQILLVVK